MSATRALRPTKQARTGHQELSTSKREAVATRRCIGRRTQVDARVAQRSDQQHSLLQDWPGALLGCEVERAPLDIAVLLSGGVDSSVALELLHRAGHRCTAFYLKIWFQEDFRNFWDNCPWEDDLAYAEETCKRLGVKLNVVPLTDEYWEMVVEDSIREIKQGRTPNPDMMCNSRIKFGAFYAHIAKEHPNEFDRVASGHYARVVRDYENNQVELVLSSDTLKDQTYFLAHLNQKQLSLAMFPLGYLSKSEVRQVAQAADLPTKDRKDSQGICFLGKVKFKEFVAEHLGKYPGPIIEEETSTVLGQHDGYWFHTIGQRQGLGLSHGPWYVVRKDIPSNTVYVSKNYYSEDKRRDAFICGQFNWIDKDFDSMSLVSMVDLQCKVRHGARMYNCTFELSPSRDQGKVFLQEDDQGLAAGQYAVFYLNGVCLGSAKILGALSC